MISLIFFLNKIIAFIRTHVEKKILIAFNKLAYSLSCFQEGGGISDGPLDKMVSHDFRKNTVSFS